ncbi:MAG: lectin like domain-containing protein [Lachnospiraceae bacterium]|nr:lectin like domain-containing protein [Lachnospiraceae bacterium]HCJ07819.1 hypothetical protein [Lachnospiraceae bacterium]
MRIEQGNGTRQGIIGAAKRLCVTMLVGIMAAGVLSGGNGMTQVQAAKKNEFVVSTHWLPAAEIHDGGDNASVTKRGAVYPARYDARDNGWVTSVKNQGNYESCWSFSSLSAIETNLIKNGRADASLDLSENQFAYFFYNRQPDKLGYTVGDYNTTSRGNYLSAGGTLQGTGLALATWAGVTTEARSPYMTIPDASLCYAADYSVRNVYLYNYSITNLAGSVSMIKQAILDHGAVACGINMIAQYYNPTNYSYNCQTAGGNHAIAIVGWDDSYSKDNFNAKPASDGAWIVKNSYGPEFGDQGYFYVSYEDRTLTEFIAFEAVTAAEQFDNNYQYDGTANPAYSYNKGEWYANVFQAKGANGFNEELKAVGVYTLTTNCNYEVEVYTGLTDVSKPTSGTKVYDVPVTGTLTDAGYQTITLPSAVSLTAGESFAVLVRLKDSYGANAYIGADSTYQNDWITFIANVSDNQSFVFVNNKWYDFGKEARANVRIKAYTDVTSEKSAFTLSDKKLGISKGTTAKLALQVSPNVYRNVKWKSSNKKVATVNGKGKVKAKSYGSATISATFMAGGNKKTLKCKVTVGPSKVKSVKVSSGKKKVKVRWKKSSGSNGYEVYYAATRDGSYKKLAATTATSCTKKMKKGTYYVKVRSYKTSGSKKLYGSFSGIKEVTIR